MPRVVRVNRSSLTKYNFLEETGVKGAAIFGDKGYRKSSKRGEIVAREGSLQV